MDKTKNLQQAQRAKQGQGNNLESIDGEQPVKMKHSDGTALPLLIDESMPHKFGADIVRFEAGKGVGLHKHVGAHILLVTKGTGILSYGYPENEALAWAYEGQPDEYQKVVLEKHDMFPGMIYLVPSNIPHAIEAITELVLVAIGNDHQPADSFSRLELVQNSQDSKENLYSDLIQKHEGLSVVRGDLVTGGLKSIILTDLLLSGEIPNKEVVYCADPYGHSQIALAIAALKSGKRATFFTTCPDVTPQQAQAMSLNNTTFHVVKDLTHQSELPDIAKKYAQEHGAYYMPIGYDFKPFNSRLITFAQSLPITPTEVWTPAGSGTTFRCLRKAWPNAKIHAVNLGMMPTVNLDGATKVYKVPEQHKEKALALPPYPSNPWYDSKIWQFVKANASPEALVWNIA